MFPVAIMHTSMQLLQRAMASSTSHDAPAEQWLTVTLLLEHIDGEESVLSLPHDNAGGVQVLCRVL
jgi:hypothetical protein